MSKTEIQIERDFYTQVKASSLGEAIAGTVYRRGQRPENAKTEDLVVKLVAGLDEQIQTGVVLLNVYVPYISYQDGRRGENLTRIGQLQEYANELFSQWEDVDYLISKDNTPQTYQQDDIEQSIIAIRIKFQRLNQE